MNPRVVVNSIYNSAVSYALSGSAIALVGPANDGPFEPQMLTQPKDAYTVFGGGPLAFWAAWSINTKRIPVLAVRAAADAVSSFGAVTRTDDHGTSVVTVAGGSATDINADVRVLVSAGGIVGVSGITLRVSTNGGLTYAAAAPLGTATSLVIPLGEEDLTLNFTAATLVTGEIIGVVASVIAAGTRSTLDSTYYPLGTNTAAASWLTSTYPDDDYEVIVEFPVGGTLGTSGIQYRVSISGALQTTDWTPNMALGTALTVVIPGTGGQTITLGTNGQTIGSGAILRGRLYAPNFNTGSVQSALTRLFQNKTDWQLCALCGAMDSGLILATEAAFAAAFANQIDGEHAWVGNARMPNLDETDAQYFTAMQSAMSAARTCYFGGVGYGDCKLISATTGYMHKRPIALTFAAEQASVAYDIDIARTDRAPLPVYLAGPNGAPDCHDEWVMPGPDDYGFITLCQQPEGVFVNNPRLFAPAGAIVDMFPHRLAWNQHTRLARNILRKLLSVQVFANKSTGTLLPSEANRIEDGANGTIDQVMAGHISNQLLTLSRTDNLAGARPATLNVSGQLQTLIYPKLINYTTQVVASVVNFT
jgi:hypothetical protein